MAGALCLAAGLGGCSFFSHSVSWTKPGVTEDQAQSDLASCTEEAKTQTDQDKSIDQDIAAANTAANPNDTSPLANMQAYKHENRFKDVLEDCMGQLGYSKVD
jgi:hypothetical protein